MNCISMIINVIFIWVGIPKPHSWQFKPAAGVSWFWFNDPPVLKVCVWHTFWLIEICGDWAVFWKHKIDAQRNSMQRTCRSSSWALICTRLVTKTMSNICQVYVVYMASSRQGVCYDFGTFPFSLWFCHVCFNICRGLRLRLFTYGTAYVPTYLPTYLIQQGSTG